MIGRTHPRFWKHFSALPIAVQKRAREKYALWTQDPHHPSLRFEERRNGICVVRIGDRYRAVGVRKVTSLPGFGSAPMRITTAFGFDSLSSDL